MYKWWGEKSVIVWSSFICVRYEKPSSSNCGILYFWWGCRGNTHEKAKNSYTQMSSSQWEAANDAFRSWKKSFVQSQTANDDYSLTWCLSMNIINSQKTPWKVFCTVFIHSLFRILKLTRSQSLACWFYDTSQLVHKNCTHALSMK